MIPENELERLKELHAAGGREALKAWVRECRDSSRYSNASEIHWRSLLNLMNDGGWSIREGLLDIEKPEVFEFAKSFVAGLLRAGNLMSPQIRELAAGILDGTVRPNHVGRPTVASPDNLFAAYHCIGMMQQMGISPYWSGPAHPEKAGDTGCRIVAEALRVSESSVKNWWKAHRRAQKAKN